MTGREIILKAADGITSQVEAEQIADAIYKLGYVCAPREPTPAMIENAWAYELAENAAGVWSSMIEESEGLVTVAESRG